MVGKPRRRPVTDEQIIEVYRETNSGNKTAKKLGIGSTTVYRVLMASGIDLDGLKKYRKRITRFRGQEQEIRSDYESGMTYDQLRERYGHASDYALKHAIKRAGGVLRENPAPLIKPGELEKIKQMNADGIGQVAISLALGRSQSFVSRVMRQNGIRTLRMVGERHSQWKGGRSKDGNGYYRVWVAHDDPLAEMRLRDGYVLEHRLVMARHLGRPLRRSETVHHINGDRTDNRLENLQLRQGKHGKHVVMCCLDCGSRNVGPAPV